MIPKFEAVHFRTLGRAGILLSLTSLFALGSYAQAQTGPFVTEEVPVGLSPQAVAVNPITNKTYVANTGSNTVTVIDGATGNPTFLGVGDSPSAIAINTATNKIYIADSGGVEVDVIDGATNAVTPVVVGYNPKAIESTNPLTATIAPLSGNVTSNASPTFNFTASSAFAPIAPPVQALYYQLDSEQGPWIAATGTAPNFAAALSSVPLGSHVLYYYATDGSDSTDLAIGETNVGAVSAYPFTIVNP